MSEETSKKRAREGELEIDVDAEEPLSKRAARRLKKGRSLAHAPSAKAGLPEEFQDKESDDEMTTGLGEIEDKKARKTDARKGGREDKKASRKTDKVKGGREEARKTDKGQGAAEEKGKNGIWIGNLSFRTTEPDLITFFTTLVPLGKSRKASEYATITPADVVRISLPMMDGRNKGFAYVDFKEDTHRDTALALSERILQGRNVLIKSADNFEGRPKMPETKDKETKILYVGNLSFETTASDLEQFFGPTMKKVRIATFEDSGKCKGFAFIDYTSPDEVKKILANKALWHMNGRKLKMEYGEDRSLRRKPPPPPEDKKVDPRTIKPGQALMNAPRASHAIVASKGMKQSFDE